MRSGGHAGLAVQCLLAAALRCWWGNPGQETRAGVVAAAEGIPLPEDAPACLPFSRTRTR